ncbi:unnamed protein product [Closterium sp. NIES-64]|nr:unnamed protein product [Closterium sp. NIES-64]
MSFRAGDPIPSQMSDPPTNLRSLPSQPGLEPPLRPARARGGGPSMTAPPALLVARSVSSSDVSGGNLPEVAWEHDATSGAGDGLGPSDGYFLNDPSSSFRMCIDGMTLSRSSALPAPALVTAQADVSAHPGAARQLEYQGGGGGGGGNGDLFYDCDDAWMRADNTWMHLDDHSAALSHFLDGLPTAPIDASDPPSVPIQPGPGSTELVTNAAPSAAETGAYILVDGAATAVDGQRCAATVGGCDWLNDILPESGYGGQPHPPGTELNQEHAVGVPPTTDSMDLQPAHQGNVEPAPGSASPPPVLSAAHGVAEESAFNPVDMQVQPAGGNYDTSASLPAGGSAPVFPTGASTSLDVTAGYAVPNPSRGVWWTPQPAAPASGAVACEANEAVRMADGGGVATRKRQREPTTKQQQVSRTSHSHDLHQQQHQQVPSIGEANRAAIASPTRARGSSRSSSSGGDGSSSSGGSGSTSRNSRADGALVCALRRCLSAHARKGAEDFASKKAEVAAEVAAEVRSRGAAAGTGPAAASGGQSRTATVSCGGNAISATTAGRDGAVQRTVLSQSQPRPEALAQPPSQFQVLSQAQTLQERQTINVALPPASTPAVPAVATVAVPVSQRPAAPVCVSPPPAPASRASPPTAAPRAVAAAVAPTPTATPPATCLPPTPAASSAPVGPARAASTAGGGTEGEGVGEAEGGEEGSWEDEEQERRRKRLMRNRQSALQSRQRRKSYVSELEGRCAALQATIGQLRQVVAVTAYENGALRDELARLHQMWAAGASTTAGPMAGALGVAGVAGVGATGGTSSEEMRGELEVEEGKREGGSVSGGGVRADGAEPAVLESDSLPSESLLRHHRHLSQTTAFLLTLFFHWALFLWVLLPQQQLQHLPPLACSAGLSLAYLSLLCLARSLLHRLPQHVPCKQQVRQWQRRRHFLEGKAPAALSLLLPAVGEALVRVHRQQQETGSLRLRQSQGQKQPGRDARGGCEEVHTGAGMDGAAATDASPCLGLQSGRKASADKGQ